MNSLAYLEMLLLKDSSYTSSQLAELLLLQMLMEVEAGIKTHQGIQMNKEYKKTDDIPVGGIMVRKNGKKYEAVVALGCTNCAFLKCTLWCDQIYCSENLREDNQSIIFIRRKDLEEKKEIGI